MRVYDFLLTIASQLGDARPGGEFRRYTLRDLSAFYGEAMCFVAAHRPDLFTDYIVMKLDPGGVQDARCCGCTSIKAVVAQIDESGSTVKDLTTSNTTTNSTTTNWYRSTNAEVTKVNVPQLIESVTITPGTNGQFSVSPAVKPGDNIFVKLLCVHAPQKPTEADVLNGVEMGDCKFAAAIRSYVLYRALQGDRHAVGASVESQNELKAVYTYLGMVYKQEKLIEEE